MNNVDKRKVRLQIAVAEAVKKAGTPSESALLNVSKVFANLPEDR